MTRRALTRKLDRLHRLAVEALDAAHSGSCLACLLYEVRDEARRLLLAVRRRAGRKNR